MLNLISVVGKHSEEFHLKQQYISDFQSLIRTVTSGRTLIVSTKFRTDLFYKAEQSKDDDILKLWGIYSNFSLTNLNNKDIITSHGEEESLSRYFDAINKLSTNWYKYRIYKGAFTQIFSNNPHNPLAETVAQCDQYLIEHTKIKRSPLASESKKTRLVLTKDTLALATKLIKNKVLSN